MNSSIEVRSYTVPWSGAVHFAFIHIRNGKTYVAEPIVFKWKEKNECEECEASLQLDPMSALSFIKSFSELGDRSGIKTDSDAKIAGTLEATREHLKDLQKLVFKTK